MPDISLLNCGDLTGTPAGVYVYDNATTATSGINFVYDQGNCAVDSIVIGDIEYRSMAFWGPSGSAVLMIQKNRGSWTKFNLRGARGTPTITCTDVADGHYAISHGIDPAGYIWITYNHHNDPLHLRRSTYTIDSASQDGSFGAEQGMLGTNESTVSYFRFIRDPADLHLYAFYRDDNSDSDADYRFIQYNHTGTPAWVSPTGLTDGRLYNGNATGDVPYNIAPIFTPDWDGAGTGYFFVHWTQRLDQAEPNGYHDICCVFWDGTDWLKSDGTTQTIPITASNADKIATIAASSGLYRGSACADTSGRIHANWTTTTDASNPASGATQNVFHSWWNPSTGLWTTIEADDSTGMFGATMVASDDGVVWIVGKDYIDDKLKKIRNTTANDFTAWDAPSDISATTITDDIFYPNYDVRAWREYNELIFPVPYTVTKPFLLANLVAHYDLRDLIESSTTNPAGTALLTNVGTTTFASGKIGNAADFENGSSQQLTRADDSILSITGSFTIGCFVNFESFSATTNGIVSKWLSTGNQRSYVMEYDTASTRIIGRVSGNGSTNTLVTANNLGAPSTSTWYGLLFDHENGVDIGLRANNGSRDSTAHTTGIFDSTALFRIGQGTSATGSNLMDGLIDELAVWTGLLDSSLRTGWYNAGNGRPYSEFGMLPPSIYSHGATATVNCNAGDTPSVTISAWGNLPMSEALTGTDAASYDVVDNADGTWTITRDSAISAGDEDVTLTLTNDAGTDAVDLTFSAAGAPGAPVNTVAPAVTGTEANGKTLTSTTGTWTGADSYAYQWYTNGTASTSGGSAIGGANASTHVLTDSQDDLYVYCVVTATNEDGSDSEPSNVVGPILRLTVVIKSNPTFADVVDFQDQTLINEAVGDAGAGEEMPAPSTWETDSPVGDVDWSAFTLAVDAAAINRSNRAGATLISPNYVVLAAHAPGDNTGHTWMTPAGVEVTRTLGETIDVDYWELGTGDLAVAKLSAAINNITPMPMILDSSKVAGRDALCIEMDRHLNVFTIPTTLDNTDEDCTVSHSRASDGLESGDSGKPCVIIIDDTPVMVITAMYTASPGGPPFTGTGPNASHFIDEIFAITAEDGESPTVWDLRSGDDGAVSGNPGSSPTGQVTSSPTNMPISLLRKYHANAR